MNINSHQFLTLSLSSWAERASPNGQEPGKGHGKAKEEAISWWSCLSHDASLRTRVRWSLLFLLHYSKTMQNYKVELFFFFPKSFPLSASLRWCCSLRTNVHVLRTRVLVAKTECLGPASVIPIPSPSGEPSAKHIQASQPLGSHRKEHFPLLFQARVVINWTAVI